MHRSVIRSTTGLFRRCSFGATTNVDRTRRVIQQHVVLAESPSSTIFARTISSSSEIRSNQRADDPVVVVKVDASKKEDIQTTTTATELSSSCGTVDDDDEMEQEEMFVDAYETFEFNSVREWGGPRRGGRLPEPTRYGDWERKGRCTDF